MARVIGAAAIQKELRKQSSLLVRGVTAGIIDASTFIERRSNKLAPRDTGFLRISSYIVENPKMEGKLVIGRVGYSAAYAAFVHEMPESNNFTTPGTGPKFLERAVKEKPRAITRVFYNTVKRFVKAWG